MDKRYSLFCRSFSDEEKSLKTLALAPEVWAGAVDEVQVEGDGGKQRRVDYHLVADVDADPKLRPGGHAGSRWRGQGSHETAG